MGNLQYQANQHLVRWIIRGTAPTRIKSKPKGKSHSLRKPRLLTIKRRAPPRNRKPAAKIVCTDIKKNPPSRAYS